MQARFFALATLVALTACGGGHTDQTQQQTTTRTTGTTGLTAAHNRATHGTSGRAGTTGSMAGSRSGAAGQPQEFDTEAAATRHCRNDEVVWLNLKTGVYHAKGTEFYGNTKNGAYACRKEADAAGDRASKAN